MFHANLFKAQQVLININKEENNMGGGLSLVSALEIYSNPHDLWVKVARKNEGSKYAFVICRGPGHNFKPIVSCEPFATTIDEATDCIAGILSSVRKASLKEARDPNSLFSKVMNPAGNPVDESKTLTPSLIKRIIGDLKKKGEADTSKMKK